MRIANIYNHLNGFEFIQYHHKDLWKELEATINSIDANKFLKISKDKNKKLSSKSILYAQKEINDAFEEYLIGQYGWNEKKIYYNVTGDINTEREIIKISDANAQKQIIESRGFEAFNTYNQVDFVKNRVAVEVQFGKYFSVAYDLHVKHTFFYLMNEIDVGIEIIPTHALMKRMDSGVAWFENEVANVIREGRSNPTVPIVIIGIEPDVFFDPDEILAKIQNGKLQIGTSSRPDDTLSSNE